ncbi:unnamed protein product [Pieris macdunnoughi]|uniref:Reverse transcriptase domain-containing protein n=1 Tax=Pieris macdunnoughi TaxID=345717 RepID=A0A821XJ92_9NEOP|nr:unnamed protein product [Pieris macdunnoughi]
MSQATWQLLNDRRELHLKLLETNDELLQADLRQQVRQICKKIYRSSRNDRRLWADSIADHAQIAINTGNMRDLYKATKILAGKRSQRKKPLKSKDGQLIVTSEGQLRRWREYFEETFRPTALSTHGDPQDTSPPPRLLNIDVEPPTRDEVARAVMGLKTGRHQRKASGGLEQGPSYNCVQKRGDLSQCSNWRGISLLLAPSKDFCRIILDRLSGAVEPLLHIEQAGFRPNRSCTDQINTLRDNSQTGIRMAEGDLSYLC